MPHRAPNSTICTDVTSITALARQRSHSGRCDGTNLMVAAAWPQRGSSAGMLNERIIRDTGQMSSGLSPPRISEASRNDVRACILPIASQRPSRLEIDLRQDDEAAAAAFTALGGCRARVEADLLLL
jgi:hypothetical protein